MSRVGFSRTQGEAKGQATPRNTAAPSSKHVDPSPAPTTSNNNNSARNATRSPSAEVAHQRQAPAGSVQRQSSFQRGASSGSAAGYSFGGRQPPMSARLQAHLDRMNQALQAEQEETERVRHHRLEVQQRAIENEMRAKERTKQVIEEHNRMCFDVQEENERARQQRLKHQHELEEKARLSVERARKNHNEWANRVSAEQDQKLQEKNACHNDYLRSRQQRIADTNTTRRSKLEERRDWMAYEQEQRDIEKARQEAERQAMVQEKTDEHREAFLAAKRAHNERVMAAQQRNEELMQDKIRAEEEEQARKERAKQSAIAKRNDQIRVRQRMKQEKHFEAQRNVNRANERRRNWEQQIMSTHEENLWIAAQTKAFNATHRKKYVPFESSTSRSASQM